MTDQLAPSLVDLLDTLSRQEAEHADALDRSSEYAWTTRSVPLSAQIRFSATDVEGAELAAHDFC
jgi:hypothetical protein